MIEVWFGWEGPVPEIGSTAYAQGPRTVGREGRPRVGFVKRLLALKDLTLALVVVFPECELEMADDGCLSIKKSKAPQCQGG